MGETVGLLRGEEEKRVGKEPDTVGSSRGRLLTAFLERSTACSTSRALNAAQRNVS
jgi:hypothetical protein